MTEPENPSSTRLSPAGWLTIVVLLGLLAWAIWDAIQNWIAMRAVHMSTLGWVFLTAGIVVTFVVGAGLMALVFYSSRHDMDH